jgi:hypothetical protein
MLYYNILGRLLVSIAIFFTLIIILIFIDGGISSLSSIGSIYIMNIFLFKIGFDFIDIGKKLNFVSKIDNKEIASLSETDIHLLNDRIIKFKKIETKILSFMFLITLILSFILLYASITHFISNGDGVFLIKLWISILIFLSIVLMVPFQYKISKIKSDILNEKAISISSTAIWIPSTLFAGGWLLIGKEPLQISSDDFQTYKNILILLLSGNRKVFLKYSPSSKVILYLSCDEKS